MLILAAHTASTTLGIAVTKNKNIVAEEILHPGREHLENISGAIERILERSGHKLTDFDGLGVTIGPGSFSGVRVGLSVFKGLAMALNVKIVGVSTLEILAWQAVESGCVAAPLIDAGRGDFYTGVFKKLEEVIQVIEAPQLLNKEKIPGVVSRIEAGEMVLCGRPELLDAILQGTTISGVPVITPSPGVCGILAENSLERGEPHDVHGLVPLYIRKSDAEDKNRNK